MWNLIFSQRLNVPVCEWYSKTLLCNSMALIISWYKNLQSKVYLEI
jgi:hypothetical protein